MSTESLEKIHQRMEELLYIENPKAMIDEIVYCPHHPRIESCACRKPKPGMLLQLAEKHQIDLHQSWMIGDRDTDVQAGKAAGCHTDLVDQHHSLLKLANKI